MVEGEGEYAMYRPDDISPAICTLTSQLSAGGCESGVCSSVYVSVDRDESWR